MSELNEDNLKYVAFTHSFEDPWADSSMVSVTFRFAKPTKIQVQRLQERAAKNSAQAARNLVLDCVHPEEKQQLIDTMEEYPGLGTTFSSAIIKGVGISAELGN